MYRFSYAPVLTCVCGGCRESPRLFGSLGVRSVGSVTIFVVDLSSMASKHKNKSGTSTEDVSPKRNATNAASRTSQGNNIVMNIQGLPMTHWGKIDPATVDINKLNQPIPPIVRGSILAFFDQLENRLTGFDGYCIADHLPGPLKDIGQGKTYNDVKDILAMIMRATNEGYNHVVWNDMQDKYCDGSRLANFVLPVISWVRNNTRAPILTNHVILSHPADCERIARVHVKKMPDQGLFLHTGVLTQLDNERWKDQRAHLVEAFLPDVSLRRLFAKSNARAVHSNGLLLQQAGIVQMNEFLLNETMAQLMLVMFGLPEEMVEDNNKSVRRAFGVALEATGGAVGGAKADMNQEALMGASMELFGFIGKFLEQAKTKVGVSETLENGAPLLGPLSARINDISENVEEKIFNAATFIFAGHDTTANTMSWLLYEVCRNQAIQDKLRAEVDRMFDGFRAGEEFCYDHLEKLPYMTRCLTETLRMWPVVPNGTFRELQFDDTVRGPNGRDVRLPKGTYVQITNWMRHRSKELWGADADVFNPDRNYMDGELWGGKTFSGYNPSTERFSPFTFAPRDCMGKNFAQMEMRVILCHLFRNFMFELAPPTSTSNPEDFVGVNRATLGPRDTGVHPDKPAVLGLYLKVTPRRGSRL